MANLTYIMLSLILFAIGYFIGNVRAYQHISRIKKKTAQEKQAEFIDVIIQAEKKAKIIEDEKKKSENLKR